MRRSLFAVALAACSAKNPNVDAGVDAGFDAGVDAGPTLNCGGLVACADLCPFDAGTCLSVCAQQATPIAIALQAALNACLEIACPSTDGGPCAMPGTACAGCHDQVTLAFPNTCA